MKKTLAMLALAAIATTASAQTTVGLDYTYLRAGGGSYLASHAAVGSVKQSFGQYGNVKLTLGSAQAVGRTRDNGTAMGAEYSYDFATPIGKLSPAIGLTRITGLAGDVVDAYTVSATLRTPINAGTRLVTAVGHNEGYNGTELRTTSAGVGVELDVTKAITLKGGYAYNRLHTLERNANAITAGVEYKF